MEDFHRSTDGSFVDAGGGGVVLSRAQAGRALQVAQHGYDFGQLHPSFGSSARNVLGNEFLRLVHCRFGVQGDLYVFLEALE